MQKFTLALLALSTMAVLSCNGLAVPTTNEAAAVVAEDKKEDVPSEAEEVDDDDVRGRHDVEEEEEGGHHEEEEEEEEREEELGDVEESQEEDADNGEEEEEVDDNISPPVLLEGGLGKPIKVFISPIMLGVTKTRMVYKTKTTYNTCYKTETGIEPCEAWSGNDDVEEDDHEDHEDEEDEDERRRRSFAVEVRPNDVEERIWDVEIRPTRASKSLDSFPLGEDVGAAVRALAKAVEGVEGGDETEAVEVLPYGDPLFRDEVGEMGLAEGRQGELSVTTDDELLEVGPPSVDGGRQQQWFERELIGLPRGCFPEDQPMSPLFLRMFSTRTFLTTSTATSYVVSPKMQTVSFASANACLPPDIDMYFSIECKN